MNKTFYSKAFKHFKTLINILKELIFNFSVKIQKPVLQGLMSYMNINGWMFSMCLKIRVVLHVFYSKSKFSHKINSKRMLSPVWSRFLIANSSEWPRNRRKGREDTGMEWENILDGWLSSSLLLLFLLFILPSSSSSSSSPLLYPPLHPSPSSSSSSSSSFWLTLNF